MLTPTTFIVLAVLAVGLSMSGTWLVWRYHKRVLANSAESAHELFMRIRSRGVPNGTPEEWMEFDEEWRHGNHNPELERAMFEATRVDAISDSNNRAFYHNRP